jgi:hypothetical protein
VLEHVDGGFTLHQRQRVGCLPPDLFSESRALGLQLLVG